MKRALLYSLLVSMLFVVKNNAAQVNDYTSSKTKQFLQQKIVELARDFFPEFEISSLEKKKLADKRLHYYEVIGDTLTGKKATIVLIGGPESSEVYYYSMSTSVHMSGTDKKEKVFSLKENELVIRKHDGELYWQPFLAWETSSPITSEINQLYQEFLQEDKNIPWEVTL